MPQKGSGLCAPRGKSPGPASAFKVSILVLDAPTSRRLGHWNGQIPEGFRDTEPLGSPTPRSLHRHSGSSRQGLPSSTPFWFPSESNSQVGALDPSTWSRHIQPGLLVCTASPCVRGEKELLMVVFQVDTVVLVLPNAAQLSSPAQTRPLNTPSQTREGSGRLSIPEHERQLVGS